VIHDSAFEHVRDEVARDLRPVRPLRSPWSSALIALPLGLFILSLVLVVYGVRSDAATIGPAALWVPASLMVAAAYIVLVFALFQRAPESTVSWVWWAVLPIGAIGIQLGGAYWTLSQSAPPTAVNWQDEAMCFLRISFLGVPPVLVALGLLSRGLPLRPKVVGFLAGLGGGLLSEGIYRLHCGMSNPGHIVPWHTGAILVMGLLGFIAGLWWENRRLETWTRLRQGYGEASPDHLAGPP